VLGFTPTLGQNGVATVNLNTMITTLKSIVSCEIFGVMESFKGTCFGHAFFKAYQYEIVKAKMYYIA
jgi:GTP-sensing pleiotropic transcriptional regulator CodY